MRTFLLALLGIALLPVVGCDSGGPGAELAPSSFTIAIGDDAEDETRSPALFGTAITDEGQERFLLLLGASNADVEGEQPFVAFTGVEMDLPDTGTYSLFDGASRFTTNVPEGEVGAIYVVPPTPDYDDLFVYIAESGSLRVTYSDEDELRGSYTIHAVEFVLRPGDDGLDLFVTGRPREISGEFRARRDDSVFEETPVFSPFGTPAVAQ